MTTTASNRDQVSFRANGLTAIVDYAVSSHARAVAVLLLAALLAFLPGFFQIPPTDRDEARFAQATKQMLETGDYVDIRFQDEVRYKKPVGIYWLQAAVVKAADALGVPNARTTIWLYRIPSLIGAIGAVLLTYWAALAFVSRRAARAGRTDDGDLDPARRRSAPRQDRRHAAVHRRSPRWARWRASISASGRHAAGLAGWTLPAIFWTALAAGILLKGPLIVMFVGLTVAGAGGDRPLGALAVGLAAASPACSGSAFWCCRGSSPSSAGPAANFFAESVGHDLLAQGGQRAGGPWRAARLYFVLFWVTFWPGATLAAMAVPSIWAARREKGAKFLLCWIVPAWIVLELVITKLPHYVLPLYPAIAILIAGVVDPHVLSRQSLAHARRLLVVRPAGACSASAPSSCW